MTLEFERLRFHLRARDRLYFRPGHSANVLRGGLGTVLPEVDPAAWERMFAPVGRAGGPSGLAEPPRPFVLRAAHLDGRGVAPGDAFHFDAHIFDLRTPVAATLSAAFEALGRRGLGPGRGRADFLEMTRLPAPAIRLDRPEPASRVLVRFVTPTELKGCGGLVSRPEFAVLAARLRDRVSTLRALYGAGPLEVDFRGMAERAAAVEMTRCDVTHAAVERRSSRTGQAHPLGGFTGEAEYRGALDEFLPYLRAGKWTGVGRQTVWGKGEIETVVLDGPA